MNAVLSYANAVQIKLFFEVVAEGQETDDSTNIILNVSACLIYSWDDLI